MADQIKKDNKNLIELEGYLKETTLQQTVKDGVNVISGTITISHSDHTDYRLRFYTPQYAKSDANHEKELSSYKHLCALLPNVSTSIASLLKTNPNAKYDDVKGAATAVWARGTFDLYDRKDEQGNIRTSVSIRGMQAGVKTAASANPFSLKADFTIDGIIDKVYPETTKEGEETGRYLMKLSAVDHYNKVSLPIDFVVEDQTPIQALQQYQAGQGGRFMGTLRSTQQEEIDNSGAIEMMDGSVDAQKVTRWINERVVKNISRQPFAPEQTAVYISPEMIKEYKINREKKLAELPVGDTKKGGANDVLMTGAPTSPVTPPSPAAQANFKAFVL